MAFQIRSLFEIKVSENCCHILRPTDISAKDKKKLLGQQKNVAGMKENWIIKIFNAGTCVPLYTK